MVEGRDFFVDELLQDYRGPACRAGVDAGRGAAVPDVHERHDRQAQGLPAQHRRLSRLRRPAPRSTSRTSTRRTCTGAWPTSAGSPATPTSSTARWRSAPRRVMYEGVPTYPGRGRPWRIAERLGREHLPHRADRDPDAAQARPGRAGEVQLPLQAHDHGRRADRAGGLALVPRRRRQGRGGHRRHLVADRERRLPVQHAAGAAADEAGQLRARACSASTR